LGDLPAFGHLADTFRTFRKFGILRSIFLFRVADEEGTAFSQNSVVDLGGPVMTLVRLRRSPRPRGLFKWAAGLWAVGLPLFGWACTSAPPTLPFLVRAAAPAEERPGPVQTLPEPSQVAPPAAVVPPAAHPPVPVSLDTVLRMSQNQNAKINISRERVREAFAVSDVAAKRWLPDLWAGVSYYRHEGGIQNEDGTTIHSSFGNLFGGVEVDTQFDVREFAYQKVSAEQKIWQRREELSRLSAETLVNAAETYIDLLAAYQGVAVIRATDSDMQRLLKFAEGLAGEGRQAELSRVRAELANRAQLIDRLRAQAEGARAKLAYLLGLGPDCGLVPVDNRLGILRLVDASVPLHDLVAQALTSGPGIREMEGLLGLIQQSIDKAKGPSKYMPVVGLRMAEGIFGAGPGDSSDWDNRFDIILQARWNLTEFVTARDRSRVAQAKINQAHLSYEDLREQLTARVEEARATVLEGLQRFRDAEEYIRQAKDASEKSYNRLKLLDIPLKSTTDVLLAIRTQLDAQSAYVGAIREYDKAQVRLLILTGQASAPDDGGHCLPHH
jgi:outer membrane protein TolC